MCSDLHLGHNNIQKYRTMFEGEEHHRSVIKENYHKVVTKRDKVFFLGDIAFTKEALEDVSGWVADSKILILGNHDTDKVDIKDIVNVFDEVYSLYKYKEFWLSHAPIHPSELRGKYNIHGHVHFQSVDDSRYFNCCLENTEYAPISLATIRERVSRGN